MLIKTLIGFFGIVYIARLLGPEYYGVYVTASTFVGMFTTVGLYGLHRAIIREGCRNPKDFEKILEENFGIKNVFLISAIVLCCVASLFTNYETSTKIYIFIFTFSIWARGLEGYVGTIYQVTEKMKYIPLFDIIETSLFVFAGILFIKLGYGVFSLVIISAYSPVITLVMRYVHSKKLVDYKLSFKLKLRSELLKAAIVFSLINFFNLLTTRVDILMISFLDTPGAVGIYGVAYKIVYQGFMLRELFIVAFFPIAIKTFCVNKVKGRSIIKYSLLFSMMMLGVATVGYFYATDLVLILYGTSYEESGKILGVLLFYLVFWWSTLPFTISLKATNNEKVVVYCMALIATMNIPLNYILWHIYGLIGIAYSTIIVWSVGSILLNLYSYYILKKNGHLA